MSEAIITNKILKRAAPKNIDPNCPYKKLLKLLWKIDKAKKIKLVMTNTAGISSKKRFCKNLSCNAVSKSTRAYMPISANQK
ncbi:hypothetical protein EHX26_08840 [Brochothrix thermosphacta]|nr:hypothetical protein [Brochothrix thermosphacta]